MKLLAILLAGAIAFPSTLAMASAGGRSGWASAATTRGRTARVGGAPTRAQQKRVLSNCLRPWGMAATGRQLCFALLTSMLFGSNAHAGAVRVVDLGESADGADHVTVGKVATALYAVSRTVALVIRRVFIVPVLVKM